MHSNLDQIFAGIFADPQCYNVKYRGIAVAMETVVVEIPENENNSVALKNIEKLNSRSLSLLHCIEIPVQNGGHIAYTYFRQVICIIYLYYGLHSTPMVAITVAFSYLYTQYSIFHCSNIWGIVHFDFIQKRTLYGAIFSYNQQYPYTVASLQFVAHFIMLLPRTAP